MAAAEPHKTQRTGNKIRMIELNNIQWSPEAYADAAIAAREAEEELLSRLDWMTLQPAVIVDVGCGTGSLSARLQARYPEAKVVSVDHSEAMLEQVQSATTLMAEAHAIPLPDQSVDLITANFLLPWHPNFILLLREWRRLLRPDGLLMISTLGPDTLREWHHVIAPEHRPICMDMHDLGDALLQEHFAEPVLDVTPLRLVYKNPQQMVCELKASGMLFADLAIELLQADANGVWPVSYEIVHAHAFAPTASNEYAADSGGVTNIPLSNLRQQLRSK